MIFSRRNLVGGTGLAAAALVSAAGAQASVSAPGKNEAAVRAWYGLWGSGKDWPAFDALLADNFTFSSANGDDHISKAEFKKQCWDTQASHIKELRLEQVMTKGDHAIVEYIGHTTAGNSFHNVEVLQLRDGRLTDMNCFFGDKANFPTAVDSRKT